MKNWKELIVALVVVVVGSVSIGLFCGHRIGWTKRYHQKAWADYEEGFDDGRRTQREMFQTPEEPNEGWRRAALGWKVAAEHYGGICKWLLDGKPIYGTIVMDANTVLRDCLIVSGSSEASIDVSGVNCFIANNYFKALDMNWVLSTTTIDPNEVKNSDDEDLTSDI